MSVLSCHCEWNIYLYEANFGQQFAIRSCSNALLVKWISGFTILLYSQLVFYLSQSFRQASKIGRQYWIINPFKCSVLLIIHDFSSNTVLLLIYFLHIKTTTYVYAFIILTSFMFGYLVVKVIKNFYLILFPPSFYLPPLLFSTFHFFFHFSFFSYVSLF